MRNALSEASRADHLDPDFVHSKLTELSKSQSALDVEIGEWLLAADRLGLHDRFGYASVFEYAERTFGWNGRTAFERLRVARKLETLPATRDQLLEGRIVWSVAREITRIAETPDVEAEWLLAVRGRTTREVEKMVANRSRNARPTDPKDPRLERHGVFLSFTSEEYARYQDSVQRERKLTGDPRMTEEQAVISSMTRGNDGDVGVAANQLAFVRKVGTDETYVQTRDGAMLVPPATAERIGCDATVVPATVNGEIVANASQTIPPATRRQVIVEAGGRCEVPGCVKCYIEVHHKTFRSDGGTNELRFLIAICWYHHQRIHDGYLQLDGDRASGWRFRHADGSAYGSPGTPKMQQGIADAYQGLRRLGYKDPDARRAAAEAATQLLSEGAEATAEAVMTRALRRAGKATNGGATMKQESPPAAHVGTTDALDAMSGLRNLGYRESEARASVDEALASLDAAGKPATAEAILTVALRARGAGLLAGEASAAYGEETARVGTDGPERGEDWLEELYLRAVAEAEAYASRRPAVRHLVRQSGHPVRLTS